MGALVAAVLGSSCSFYFRVKSQGSSHGNLSLVMDLTACSWHNAKESFGARHWCSGSQTRLRTDRKFLTLLGILKCLHAEFTLATRKYGCLVEDQSY